MKEHKFDSNVENIYASLSNEQKREYRIKQDRINKLFIAFGILFGIILLAIIIGFGIWLLGEKEYALLAFTVVSVVLMSAIVFWFISSGIRGLKSTDEMKIKKYIERLEQQKKRPSDNTTTTNIDIKTKITYCPPSENNDEIISLTNRFFEDFANNKELCDIIEKNIQNIDISIYTIEILTCPFQKKITEKTYCSSLKDVITNNIKTQKTACFCLPIIQIESATQYVDFIKQWNDKTLQILNKIYDLDDILSYKNNSTLKDYFASKYKLSGVEKIFQLLKRQQIIHNEDSTNRSVNVSQYIAFLFLIRKSIIESFKEEITNIIKVLNINIESEPQEIITQLYNYPLVQNDSIVAYYSMIEYLKINNCSTPFIRIYYENYDTVQNILRDIQDREKLEDLRRGNYQNKQYSMLEIDRMSDVEFESFVAELFSNLGYQAKTTPKSGDQGVDVIAQRGNQIIAIQAKHYSQTVGNHAIMEVVGGAKFYNATLCYVVTNNYFTKSAKELAAANNVILWDRDRLIEKLGEI